MRRSNQLLKKCKRKVLAIEMDYFIDTSFLMPLFKIETEIPNLKEELDDILSSGNVKFYFSPVSVIEIKWQVIKAGKSDLSEQKALEQAFSKALDSIKRNSEKYEKVSFLDSQINDISYQLMSLGHKDYFDTIIGASAIRDAITLISLDEDLKKVIKNFLSKSMLYTDIEVLNWNEFKYEFKSMGRSPFPSDEG